MDTLEAFQDVGTDRVRWLLTLADDTRALESLTAFLDHLDQTAKDIAVQPDSAIETVRACQVYHKLVLDFRVFMHTTLAEYQYNVEEEEDGPELV